MKKLTLFLVLAFCLTAISCSKDAEANAFLTEFASVTTEMSQKLEAGSVDEAKKVLDGKKDALKTKFDSFKNAREVQISAETKKKLETDTMANMKKLTDASMKAMQKNPSDAVKIQALLKDLTDVIKM